MYKDFLMMYRKTSKSKRKLFQKEFGIYSPHIQPHFPVQMRTGCKSRCTGKAKLFPLFDILTFLHVQRIHVVIETV